MSILVTTALPVLVRPSKPMPMVTIKPTSADECRLGLSFTAFFIFKQQQGCVDELAETIRLAPSPALDHFFPFAGRVAIGTHGDAVFSCTGEGVLFVSATANCTWEKINFLDGPLAIPLADLAIRYGGGCRIGDPLLTLKVTEFKCGGFIVGVTWNHGIADTCGVAQLLRTVGEFARGYQSPSVVPIRYDKSLPDFPQLAGGSLGDSSKNVEYAYCNTIIPWTEFVAQRVAGGQPCSVFDVVTAALWQCRTRASRGSSGGAAPAELVFTANVRNHVGAKNGYYGNCIMRQVVSATADMVTNGHIVNLVKLIKDAKEQIPELLRNKQELQARDADRLYVSSWAHLGLDGVDFGGGSPAVRVIPDMELAVKPYCYPCLPCSRTSGDGVNVVAWCVTDDHLDVFQAELARLQ